MNYTHMGKSQSAMDWLNYWIKEREEIRRKKEGYAGPEGTVVASGKPWSVDPIFQTTYFCNVRREDDKVTRWIRQNWTPTGWTWEEYDYYIVMARMLNNIPCLESIIKLAELTGGFSFEELQEHLEERAEHGAQVWGGAYVVTSHGLRMPKAAYLCRRVLPAAYTALVGSQTPWARYMGSGPTLARSHDLLMQLEGLGSFMAAQVIADLKNTEGHPLQSAEDWSGWSAPGPGSLRGLGWIFGLGKVSPGSYERAMYEVWEKLTLENIKILSGSRIYVNMQDLQNCLCEFDKFMRVMTKTGKSKRKYDGR